MLTLAITSALLFGLVPAINGTGDRVDASLRSSRSSTAGVGVRRLRRALVAAQFAIATPLLIVAGLLLTSLNELKSVDPGFDAGHLLSGAVRLPAAQYREPASVNVFWDELQRRLDASFRMSPRSASDSSPGAAPTVNGRR